MNVKIKLKVKLFQEYHVQVGNHHAAEMDSVISQMACVLVTKDIKDLIALVNVKS